MVPHSQKQISILPHSAKSSVILLIARAYLARKKLVYPANFVKGVNGHGDCGSDRREPAERSKSTGPRTEEGKNRSRMNSLDHGGRASILVLPPEEFAQYEEWRLAWKKAFRPRSAAEEVLIDRITALDWQEKWIKRASSRLSCASRIRPSTWPITSKNKYSS